MCPERQLLSVYVDSELPSPWKEKLQAHLAECTACSRWVARQIAVHTALQDRGEDVEAAKARVWKGLNQRIVSMPPRSSRTAWIRNARVPLPAAIAVALVFAFLAAWLGGPLLNRPAHDTAISQLGQDIQGVIPVSDMSSVLQYLDSQNTDAEIVIIRLPESRNFTAYGEPALVRAADYSRRQDP